MAAKKQGYSSVRLGNMAGGLNTETPANLLKDNESPVSQHVDRSLSGIIRPALGRVARYDSAFSATGVNGAGAYYKSDGTSRLLLGADSSLYADTPHLTKVWDTASDWGTPDASITTPPAFSRASIAYDFDGTAYASGVARFVTLGSKAGLLVERAVTNLLTANQSDVETNTTGFVAEKSATLTRVTTEHFHGAAALKVVTPGSVANEGFHMNLGTAYSASTKYAGQVRVKGSGTVEVFLWDGHSHFATQTATLTSSWQAVSISGTSGATISASQMYIWTTTAQAITFYYDVGQLEKDYATTLGGTFRVGDVLTLPGTVLAATEGTVELAFYLPATGGGPRYLFDAGGATDKNLELYVNTDGVLEAVYGTGSAEVTLTGTTTLSAETWYRARFEYDADGASLYLRTFSSDTFSTAEDSSTTAASITPGTDLYIASDQSSENQLDGLVRDLRISDALRGTSDETDGSTMDGSSTLQMDLTADFDWQTKYDWSSAVTNGSIALADAATVGNDATIGDSTAGSVGHILLSTGTVYAQKVALQVATRVTSVTLGGFVSGSRVTTTRAYIYADSSGTPGALKGHTDETAMAATGTTVLDFATALDLDAGDYWLAYELGGSDSASVKDAQSSGTFKTGTATYGTDPEPASWTTATSGPLLYATGKVLHTPLFGAWDSDEQDESNASDLTSGKLEFTEDDDGETINWFTRSRDSGGTWGAWTALNADGTLASAADAKVQVRAVLSRASSANSPAVSKATLSYDGSPSVTSLATDFTAGGFFRFLQAYDNLIVTNGIDAPRTYDGTDLTDLGGSPPSFTFMVFFAERVWGFRSSSHRSRGWFSDLGDAATWDILNFIDFAPDDGDEIRGAKVDGSMIAVAKDNSVWLVTGNSIDNFAIEQNLSSRGNLADGGFVVVDDNAATLVRTDGLYATDFTATQFLGERIKPTWADLNARKLNLAQVGQWEHNLYVSAPGATETKNTTTFVLDRLNNAWDKLTFGASCFFTFREGGEEKLFLGDPETGQVYTLSGTMDKGALIPFKWRSKSFDLGVPERTKYLAEVWIEALADGVAGSLSVRFQPDLGPLTSAMTVAVPLTGDVVTRRIRPSSVIGKTRWHRIAIQIEETASGARTQIHSIAFVYLLQDTRVTV